MWLVALTALADPPLEALAARFPGAEVTTHDGLPAIAPVHRLGEVGVIFAGDVSSLPVDGGTLVAFRLQTTRASEVPSLGLDEPPRTWSRVLSVILLGPDGALLGRAAGFPIEHRVTHPCFGDDCDPGPWGRLEIVDGRVVLRGSVDLPVDYGSAQQRKPVE